MVERIAHAYGVDHHDVNAGLNAALQIEGVAADSIEQLTERLRLGGVFVDGRLPRAEISARFRRVGGLTESGNQRWGWG